MHIKLGYELVFDLPAPVSMLLMLYVHPEQAHVLQHARQGDAGPT